MAVATEAAEEAAEKEFDAEFEGVDGCIADGAGVQGAEDQTAKELDTGGQRNEDRRPEPVPFHTRKTI